MSRILKATLLSLAGLALSSTAFAACGGNVCTTATGYAPTQTWASGSQYGYTGQSAYSSNTYNGGYYTGTTDYTTSSPSYYGFSGSTASIQGLGANESLQPTTCPVNVYSPQGGKVLGCYNVVKAVTVKPVPYAPLPQMVYYRIVRPIVYVRYPVPVALPTYNYFNHYSQYGQYGHFNQFNQGCAGAAYASRYGHSRYGSSRYGNAHYGRSRYGHSGYEWSQNSHYGYSASSCG